MKITVFFLLLATLPLFTGCKPPVPRETVTAHYLCPMHPQITSDTPGSCSICGMDLVLTPRFTGSNVTITSESQQRIGLTLSPVEKRAWGREIRAPATIVADETKLYHVNTKVDGWVEKMFVATTGQYVRKGDPLFTLYSPSLMSAQAEHLSADDLLRPVARRRLELMDMTDEQIARLEETKQIHKTMTVYAPASGYLIERSIATGHKVNAGDLVLTLADLSNVWADADLFQNDIALVNTGIVVEIIVNDQNYIGNVNFISPTVDPETHTVKVRVELPNPNMHLKPGMWATAHLKIHLGERLTIPSVAVLRTGERIYAFKDTGDGHFVPVELKIGARDSGWLEVLRGLADGDKVVTSANFLVDSESQLQAAWAGIENAHAR